MMLKPKTPYSLPKSAMAKLDGVNPVPSSKIDKVMMTSNEPAVIIQKSASNSKKMNDKKNQGPTRDEVFGKIDQILEKLKENESTNEAFTSWKEINIPAKMVNNALIHLFKQILKQSGQEERSLICQLVDQLYTAELVTTVQVRESLARMVTAPGSTGDQDHANTIAELAAWALQTEKVKLVEVAEMTEGGSSHPLFLSILQVLAAKDEAATLAKFKDSGVKLTDQLPTNMRTEEQLGEQLAQRKLCFLVPLLSIKADMWKHLEAKGNPSEFLAWIQASVPAETQKEASFVSAMVSAVIRLISEATTLAEETNTTPDKEVVDKEKEMVLAYKDVLQPFLNTQELQLIAIYALQVFCFSRGFPKGLLLRWFLALYEADLVEEQVFLKWKEDVNDSYPGKGKSLFQVNQWLTWLEEAESEDEDDDEE
jgi:translation initiation factor 4G